MCRILSDRYIVKLVCCCIACSAFLTVDAENEKNQLRTSSREKIIVKGCRTFPPYEFIDDQGNPDGFNIDLIHAVLTDLNIPYELTLDYWPQVMTELQQGKVDLVTGMMYSRQRAQLFKFGPVYASMYLNVVYRKGEPPVCELNDLQSRRIVVQANSISRDILREKLPQTDVVEVNDLNQGLRLLSEGQYDFAVCAQETAQNIIYKQGLSNLDRVPLNTPAEEYRYAGNNDLLLSQIEQSLNKLKRNGTYDRIYDKWFNGTRNETIIPGWVYLLVVVLVLAAVLSYAFIHVLRLKVRKASWELKRENLKLLLAIKGTNTVFWEYDRTTDLFKSYNEPINDYDETRLLSLDDYHDSMDREDMAALRPYVDMMRKGGDESYSVDVKIKTRYDTEWRFCTITSMPFEKDRQTGRIVKYVGFRRDNTEIVKLNREVNDSVQKMRYVLYHSNTLIWNYNIATGMIELDYGDEEGNIQRLSVDEYLNKRVPPSRHNVMRLFFGRLSEGREADFTRQVELLSTDDAREIRYAIINGTPIRDPSGKIVAYSGLRRDITDLIRTQQRLQAETERAQQSDTLKSAFLANMSHEIRTPLNAIVGFSTLLETAADADERAEYINIINQNNDLLLRLISDILDLSKLESGIVELRPETLDMAVLFEDTYAALKLRCVDPRVEFLARNPYAECIVCLDKDRLVQVGTNFVTNAIKYTHEGHILMGYEYCDGGIRIYVEDTGVGIPQDKRQQVFERFEKLDRFIQGTGLGLAICRVIVEACGGRIGVDSEEGKGSTFWAWIPCTAQIVEKETACAAEAPGTPDETKKDCRNLPAGRLGGSGDGEEQEKRDE